MLKAYCANQSLKYLLKAEALQLGVTCCPLHRARVVLYTQSTCSHRARVVLYTQSTCCPLHTKHVLSFTRRARVHTEHVLSLTQSTCCPLHAEHEFSQSTSQMLPVLFLYQKRYHNCITVHSFSTPYIQILLILPHLRFRLKVTSPASPNSGLPPTSSFSFSLPALASSSMA